MNPSKPQLAVVLVGVLLLAMGAGAYTGMIGTYMFGTEVKEPIDITEQENWSTEMYPGETMMAEHSLENPNATEDYVVTVELMEFNGTGNLTDAVNASRTKQNGYISKVEWAGQDHTFDLLNDGKADFYKINESGSVNQVVNVTTLESAMQGQINMTFNYSRVSSETAPSAVVEQHYSASDDCGNCHTGNSSTAVHDNKLSASDTCESCHEASMQDLHMDCTSGCHQSYPITNASGGAPHGPFADKPVQSEYYCGQDCHGDQLSHAHNNTNATKSGYDPVNMCPTCHGDNRSVEGPDTLMNLHNSSTFTNKDCVECHGLESNGIHSTYEGSDCQTCHNLS